MNNFRKMLLKKLILTFCFSTLITSLGYSQIWPFTPMSRLGNAVYVDTDKESLSDLSQENILFEKGLEDRFFDVITSNDSLAIEIDDQAVQFFQKARMEPKNRKTFLFYSRRKLENTEQKITYLKIKKIEQNKIIAEATIKNKNSGPHREKKLIKININDLNGVFIGPNKGMRTTSILLGIAGGIGTLLLL